MEQMCLSILLGTSLWKLANPGSGAKHGSTALGLQELTFILGVTEWCL